MRISELLGDDAGGPSVLDLGVLPPAPPRSAPRGRLRPLGVFEAEEDTLELDRRHLPGPIVAALVTTGAVSLLAMAGALALG